MRPSSYCCSPKTRARLGNRRSWSYDFSRSRRSSKPTFGATSTSSNAPARFARAGAARPLPHRLGSGPRRSARSAVSGKARDAVSRDLRIARRQDLHVRRRFQPAEVTRHAGFPVRAVSPRRAHELGMHGVALPRLRAYSGAPASLERPVFRVSIAEQCGVVRRHDRASHAGGPAAAAAWIVTHGDRVSPVRVHLEVE